MNEELELHPMNSLTVDPNIDGPLTILETPYLPIDTRINKSADL